MAWLDSLLGDGPYLCGQRFTVADILLYVWLEFGQAVQQPFNRRLPNVTPWFDRMAARPSATKSRQLLATERALKAFKKALLQKMCRL